MEAYSTLGSVFTVLSFVVFVGIVFWAYSGRRKPSFDRAANEPFALPDEGLRHVSQPFAPGRLPAGRGERNESPRDSRKTGAHR